MAGNASDSLRGTQKQTGLTPIFSHCLRGVEVGLSLVQAGHQHGMLLLDVKLLLTTVV